LGSARLLFQARQRPRGEVGYDAAKKTKGRKYFLLNRSTKSRGREIREQASLFGLAGVHAAGMNQTRLIRLLAKAENGLKNKRGDAKAAEKR
jgi:hypothetical protein